MRRLTWRDRVLAWLATGPIGRGVAFVLDLLMAVWNAVRQRFAA